MFTLSHPFQAPMMLCFEPCAHAHTPHVHELVENVLGRVLVVCPSPFGYIHVPALRSSRSSVRFASSLFALEQATELVDA